MRGLSGGGSPSTGSSLRIIFASPSACPGQSSQLPLSIVKAPMPLVSSNSFGQKCICREQAWGSRGCLPAGGSPPLPQVLSMGVRSDGGHTPHGPRGVNGDRAAESRPRGHLPLRGARRPGGHERSLSPEPSPLGGVIELPRRLFPLWFSGLSSTEMGGTPHSG